MPTLSSLPPRDKALLRSNKGFFLFMFLTLFASELAVMEVFIFWFPRLGKFASALLDSMTLTLILSGPVWFAIIRPRHACGKIPPENPSFFQRHLFGILLALIFAIDFSLMLSQPQLWPESRLKIGNMIDALLFAVIATPMLWLLFLQAGSFQPDVDCADILEMPQGIYALLLVTIFSADMIQEALLPFWVPKTLHVNYQLIDSIITTLLVAPILWLLIARPLRRSRLFEQAHREAIHVQLLDAVVAADSQGEILMFNPAAERIFGYSAAEIIGKPVASLFAAGEDAFDKLRLAALSEGGGTLPFRELAGRRCDRSQLTMEVSLSPIYQDDRREFLLIMRDTTSRREAARALRESENRFREIFEQSEDAIIFFKPGGCSIIDVNTTAIRLFGYAKEEFFSGGADLLVNTDDSSRFSTVIDVVNKTTLPQGDTFSARRRDGEEFIVSMRCKIMTLQGVDVVFCTFRDVTDRVRMEEEAREIQAKLIQANKMTSLGLLVSGVAHEINNPNNYILANARILAQSWSDARNILAEYAAENGDFLLGGIPFSQLAGSSNDLYAGVLDGAQRINEIVKNLKSFARQDRSSPAIRFDLNQVATSAVAIIRHELVRHTEHFQVDLAADLPPAFGSAQQIGQVVINLLMNACQALPSKSHGIWLTTAYDTERMEIVISVRDEGYGISAEESRRILEPFFTTKLDSGGTGLGLSICQSIVREHHGRLEFTSELGQGSVFSVYLPALRNDKDAS